MKKLWDLMVEEGKAYPTKTQLCADAWGIRKLMSHALRNLRQDRNPRAPWLQYSTGFALIKGDIYMLCISSSACLLCKCSLIFIQQQLFEFTGFFGGMTHLFSHLYKFLFAPLSLERFSTSTRSSSEHGILVFQSSLLDWV